jgi:hypothetical protein
MFNIMVSFWIKIMLKKYYVYIENKQVPYIIRASSKKQILNEWNSKIYGKITSIVQE